MAVKSKMTQHDVTFLSNLIVDISNELCECDCCKKEQGCSIFERMYIAGNLLYKNVIEENHTIQDGDTSLEYIIPVSPETPYYIQHYINIFDDDICIEWETLSYKINANTLKANKFVNKSRKKILSRFYKFIYNKLLPNDIPAYSSNYVALKLSEIFGTNSSNVIDICIDDCCNN